MTYFMSFSSLAWIFLTTSGLLSQQRWLFTPEQLFNPGQTYLRKILSAWLCSSAHNLSVAPIVFRVKFTYLRLAFSSFQIQPQYIFSLTSYKYFSFHLKFLLPFFPVCCTNFCLLDSFPLYLLLRQLPALCFFYQIHSGFTGFFSHTSLDFYWIFFWYSVSVQLNGKQLGSVTASARLGFLTQSP